MSSGSPPDDQQPRKRPERKGFLLRLPPELIGELRGWANQELRSLNSHLEYLLRESLKRRRGGEPPADPEARPEEDPK